MILSDKVVLITGAGKGTGRAMVRLFAAQGARVAVNDISPVNLDSLVDEGQGRIQTYTEDIAKKVGMQAVLKQVEDDFGRLDILVNHAAVEPRASILDMDEWDWHRVLDVNLTGAFLGMQSAGRIMKQNRAGLIINWVGLKGSSFSEAAYAASMYGLIAMTRVAAAELGPHGVFVHALGCGIAQFQDADPIVPGDLQGALLYLCNTPRNGQIVNVEAE